jgi:hypothetical protein
MTPADLNKARSLVANSMVLARDLEPLINAIAKALADEREEAAKRIEKSPRRFSVESLNAYAPAYVCSVTREDCMSAVRRKN